jgi:hypothetical protein
MTHRAPPTRGEANDHPARYEPYEQRIGPVLLFALGLAGCTLLVLALMKVAVGALGREAREGAHAIHPLAASTERAPEPRLQDTPALDLQRLREREETRLSTYGWIDRPGGVVHIPIERAMEIVAGEGLPARAAREGSAR